MAPGSPETKNTTCCGQMRAPERQGHSCTEVPGKPVTAFGTPRVGPTEYEGLAPNVRFVSSLNTGSLTGDWQSP